MSGAVTIETHDISKRYGDRTVVRNVNLRISAGEIFGFLGPNGSGKSTTIKMLCTLVPPTSGSGAICGFDVVKQGDQVRRSIGYMSQSFALYGDLTVRENLEFYGLAYNLNAQRRRARSAELIAFTHLEPYVDQLAETLSGGWKQRLALAAALLHEPRVVFLDEPTAGIDPVARRDLWDLLFTLGQKGVTLFVTTHYMDEAERCSRVAYIENGDLIASGTRDELRALPAVTPAGFTRYRAAAHDVVAAFAAAKALAYMHDVTIFGSVLHIVVPTDVSPTRIAADLGVPADSIERIEPSLEDVFVALTRARREAAAA